MSTIIIITPPVKPQRSKDDDQDTTIKIKLEGEGSVSQLLREAADVIDGQQE